VLGLVFFFIWWHLSQITITVLPLVLAVIFLLVGLFGDRVLKKENIEK